MRPLDVRRSRNDLEAILAQRSHAAASSANVAGDRRIGRRPFSRHPQQSDPMSREDFVAIASRLFSVYLLFQCVGMLPNLVTMASQSGGDALWLALYALVAALAFGACAVLWFFPLTIARKLLPVMREPRSEQQLDASIAMSIGLTLLGVWFFAQAFADAVYWFSLLLISQRMPDMSFVLAADQVASICATVAELVVAVWLLFGNAGIKRLIYRFRYGDS
ncbi:MAG: hypothetical protein E6Q50_13960 [Lysobacter sp.]|nr:MAG: hypothetical protein E6Q50_13960 [Lysobacter sp.]